MTVNENLEIGAYMPRAKAERGRTLELVFSIFPGLAERRKQLAGTMSGGEQQMLAVGRGLMLKPRFDARRAVAGARPGRDRRDL